MILASEGEVKPKEEMKLTEAQQATLTHHAVDFAMNWRHMVAGLEARVRDAGRAALDDIAEKVWTLCLSMGEGQTIIIREAEEAGIPAAVMASYVGRALVWAEKGRFLSFTTAYKTNTKRRTLVGIRHDGRVYPLDYLQQLAAAKVNPEEISTEQALTLPTGDVRPIKSGKRNQRVIFRHWDTDRIGETNRIVVMRNPHTVDADPAKRKDPAEELQKNEDNAIVTFFSPTIRQKVRAGKQHTADETTRYCEVLKWLGDQPGSQDAKDALYTEKNGDGVQSMDARYLREVHLGGHTLHCQVAE